MQTVHNRRTRYRRTDMLVVPGLIDSHSHAVQYLTKGIGDDVHIFDWMYKRVNPYEALMERALRIRSSEARDSSAAGIMLRTTVSARGFGCFTGSLSVTISHRRSTTWQQITE